MFKLITHIEFNSNFLTEVRTYTSYIKNPVTLICDRVLNYIGVQMALPFRKDKKSGVMKSALETSCAILTRTIRPASGNTPKSRKSVLVCLESTTLQLGAGGETA